MKPSIFTTALLSLCLTSLSAVAANQSQTFIHYANGTFQTLPPFSKDYLSPPNAMKKMEEKNAAFLFDTGARSASVVGMGANYALLPNADMVTVDEQGNASVKSKTYYTPGFQASVLGGNYFLEKGSNQIIVIDSDGFYVTTGIKENQMRSAGGNFYIDQTGTIVTIPAIAQMKNMDGTYGKNPGGAIYPTRKTGMGDFSKVTKTGGNYLVNADGSIHTIESANGFLYGPYQVGTKPKKLGGNYFIGEDNVLYTVSSAGIWQKQMPVLGTIKTYGYSYFIADDGYFVFVDGNGAPHTQLIHFLNNEAESVQKIMNYDTPPSFIPANQ